MVYGMALAHQHNPVAALRDFVDRMSPFDAAPDGSPAATIEITLGRETASFELTEHVVRGLCEALYRYYDPADVGPCDRCGRRRLDQNMQCRDCGHVNGVFGQILLEHAERMARESRSLEP